MPVFLISLHPPRLLLDELEGRLKEHPDVVGIDGRILPASEYFSRNIERLRRRQRPLTPAEVGCALSHLEAYRRLLQGGATSAWVFEDDVQLRQSEFGWIDAEEVGSRFDVIVLGCQDGLEGERLLYGRPLKGTPVFALPRRFTRYLFRSAAYWIAADAAARIVECQSRLLRPADSWGHWTGELGLRVGFANICAHPRNLAGSTIEHERLGIDYSPPRPRLKQWRSRLHDRFVSWRDGLQRCHSRPEQGPAS